MKRLGTLLAVVGIGIVLWAGLTVLWQEPFTGMYAAWQQRQLEGEWAEALEEYDAPVKPFPGDASEPAVHNGSGGDDEELARLLAAAARDYRRAIEHGEPMGRLRIPELGIDSIVVDGAEGADLRSGPGRDRRSFMPGEGKLVYIAAHRTTYGAPFRHIDDLEPGDVVTLDVPYARFVYRVSGHVVVTPDEVDRLEPRGREEIALQASHPPYSAAQRYIVYGQFVRAEPA